MQDKRSLALKTSNLGLSSLCDEFIVCQLTSIFDLGQSKKFFSTNVSNFDPRDLDILFQCCRTTNRKKKYLQYSIQ